MTRSSSSVRPDSDTWLRCRSSSATARSTWATVSGADPLAAVQDAVHGGAAEPRLGRDVGRPAVGVGNVPRDRVCRSLAGRPSCRRAQQPLHARGLRRDGPARPTAGRPDPPRPRPRLRGGDLGLDDQGPRRAGRAGRVGRPVHVDDRVRRRRARRPRTAPRRCSPRPRVRSRRRAGSARRTSTCTAPASTGTACRCGRSRWSPARCGWRPPTRWPRWPSWGRARASCSPWRTSTPRSTTPARPSPGPRTPAPWSPRCAARTCG